MDYTEFRNSLGDRKVLVVGMGRSGKAAIDVLLRFGADVTAQDASDPSKIDAALTEHLEKEGVQTYFGRLPEDIAYKGSCGRLAVGTRDSGKSRRSDPVRKLQLADDLSSAVCRFPDERKIYRNSRAQDQHIEG